ncbi:membrane progestin receptor beta [Tachysurus fulvidraco]|uniref:membrane progestin receptor beta n=1 Tax=Tachysurus fulvidraco TaxID=1234273 RepID=UPI001FEE2818|nr:membrane progestin receptor beta [Tachysurus fulvidraco]
MSSGVLGRLSNMTINIKQLVGLPRLSPSLHSLPSPQATVGATNVPGLFREPYIHSGYRPVGQPWHCYALSLFQSHNELLNVWSHLLAVPVVLLRFWLFAATGSLTLDASSLPLCLYILSSLTYLTCSTVAHLLQSHSELSHYSLFFLDYVGVAVYQYGSALAHYFYCSEEEWRQSLVGALFLPGAALLGWVSCASCCFAKLRYRRPYPLHRKIFQIVPTGMAYILDISPVALRLASRHCREPVLVLHALQVAFFLLAAFFFSCPVPERFFPGKCDIVGQGHQIFHIFLVMCTMCQMEAVFKDFSVQKSSIVKVHGEFSIWLAAGFFFILVLCSMLTAARMRQSVQRHLQKERMKSE